MYVCLFVVVLLDVYMIFMPLSCVVFHFSSYCQLLFGFQSSRVLE